LLLQRLLNIVSSDFRTESINENVLEPFIILGEAEFRKPMRECRRCLTVFAAGTPMLVFFLRVTVTNPSESTFSVETLRERPADATSYRTNLACQQKSGRQELMIPAMLCKLRLMFQGVYGHVFVSLRNRLRRQSRHNKNDLCLLTMYQLFFLV
jgi:hypothetical protein